MPGQQVEQKDIDKPLIPEVAPIAPELGQDFIKEKTAKPEAVKELEKPLETQTSQDSQEQPGRAPVVSTDKAVDDLTADNTIPAPQVENILEEDLQDIWQSMTQEEQQEFKQAGEQAAVQISNLLQSVKVKVSEITKLIVGWLKFIPGVNKFFIEQEAKIKTDKLLESRDRKLKTGL
ncbi:MAG: hypothetical protein ABII24_01445 [bacterium]